MSSVSLSFKLLAEKMCPTMLHGQRRTHTEGPGRNKVPGIRFADTALFRPASQRCDYFRMGDDPSRTQKKLSDAPNGRIELKSLVAPALGGNNSVANAINDRGEVGGEAETSDHDPNCPAPQILQFKPAIWRDGRVSAF